MTMDLARIDDWRQAQNFRMAWQPDEDSDSRLVCASMAGWEDAGGMLSRIPDFRPGTPLTMRVLDMHGRDTDPPDVRSLVRADIDPDGLARVEGLDRGFAAMELRKGENGERDFGPFVPRAPFNAGWGVRFAVVAVGGGLLIAANGTMKPAVEGSELMDGDDVLAMADELHAVVPLYGRGMRILDLAMVCVPRRP